MTFCLLKLNFKKMHRLIVSFMCYKIIQAQALCHYQGHCQCQHLKQQHFFVRLKYFSQKLSMYSFLQMSAIYLTNLRLYSSSIFHTLDTLLNTCMLILPKLFYLFNIFLWHDKIISIIVGVVNKLIKLLRVLLLSNKNECNR